MEDISGNMITSGKRYEVRNKQPDEWRRQVLPVPATVVPANGVAQVQVQPQRLFKGKRLSLTQTDGAGAFVTGCRIADLKIGQNSQFVAAGNQPVECYKPEAVSSYVDLDDADIG
ncbi:MAG: hypothetical protein CL510_10215, partial [Actinobacteria bacterium]|nr:hypothetical protein [Actinomycetota bacterium]